MIIIILVVPTKDLNIRLTFLVVIVLPISTYNHARIKEERGFVVIYVVLRLCLTHPYCDLFRISMSHLHKSIEGRQ